MSTTTLNLRGGLPGKNPTVPFDCTTVGATVSNGGPNTVYFRDRLPVTASLFDGSIVAGASQDVTGTQYFTVDQGAASSRLDSAFIIVSDSGPPDELAIAELEVEADEALALASASSTPDSFVQTSGNIGATLTLSLASRSRQAVVGTVNADLTVSVQNRKAGARFIIWATVGAASHSIALYDGTNHANDLTVSNLPSTTGQAYTVEGVFTDSQTAIIEVKAQGVYSRQTWTISAAVAGRYFAVTGSPWNNGLPALVTIDPLSTSLYVPKIEAARAANVAKGAGGWNVNRNSFGVALYEVTNATPMVPVTYWNGTFPAGSRYQQTQSDTNATLELAWRFAQGVPIPSGAVPAQGNDRHLVIVNTDTKEMWTLWKATNDATLGWVMQGGGYIPDHTANIGQQADLNLGIGEPREFHQWGGDATSLPPLAGLALESEYTAFSIPHALQMVFPTETSGRASDFRWPALRGDATQWSTVPLGAIIRLKQSFDVSTLSVPGNTLATSMRQAIGTALKTYGAIINDHGAIGGPIALRFQQNLSVSDVAALGLAPSQILNEAYGTMWHSTDLEVVDAGYRP